MDIDEFLDKELRVNKEDNMQDVNNGSAIEEKGSIKNYFDLWNKVSKAKFIWDGNLYSELEKATNMVKQELRDSSLTIEREKNAIKSLISKAIEELRHNNYDSATKLYSQITDMWNNFPDYLIEEKKDFNKEIFQLYEKLHDQIDSKFIIDFKSSIDDINKFIKDAFSNLGNNMDEAKMFYEKALELYKDLPMGFLPQKLELGGHLITLYKDLSVQTQIGSLQKHLSKKPVSYKYVSSDDKIKRLSEINKKSHNERFPILHESGRQSKTLIQRLLERKIDRAKVNIKKGLYVEAKNNIKAILKIDPHNEEAKELLNGMPLEF